MNHNELKANLRENAEKTIELIWGSLQRVNIETVENSDGRTSEAHEACKKGSFLYLLYTIDDILLYVGETGESIKTRLTGDGSGSHNKKEWYQEVAYIKYYLANNNNFSAPERKILEESFSLIKEPLHYGRS